MANVKTRIFKSNRSQSVRLPEEFYMKKAYFISCLIFMCCLVFGTEETSAFSNQYQFTIPSRGIKVYEVRVPENAKRIKAVISGQTEMVNLALYGPGKDVPSCKTTTWSNLSNWKKPLHCSINIVPKRGGQGPGIWRVKVEGSVHKGKVDKIKSVSGLLTIRVDGTSSDYTSSTKTDVHSSAFSKTVKGHIEILKFESGRGNFSRPKVTCTVQVSGPDISVLKLWGVSSGGQYNELKTSPVKQGDKISFSAEFPRSETQQFELRLYDSKGNVVARSRRAG